MRGLFFYSIINLHNIDENIKEQQKRRNLSTCAIKNQAFMLPFFLC